MNGVPAGLSVHNLTEAFAGMYVTVLPMKSVAFVLALVATAAPRHD
jgi:hypothetical protein